MLATCPECRHVVDLGESPSGKCGNCGAMVSAPAPKPSASGVPVVRSQPQTSPTAAGATATTATVRPASIVALVAGLLLCIPIIPQVVALISGATALLRSPRPGERRGAAVVGLMLGLLGLGGWVVVGVTGVGPPAWITAWRTGVAARQPAVSALDVGNYSGAMERVLLAATSYRRDFGRWPQSVADLAGSYLPADYRLPVGVCFVPPDPGVQADDRVLLISEPIKQDFTGVPFERPKRVVALLNGKVEERDAEAVAVPDRAECRGDEALEEP